MFPRRDTTSVPANPDNDHQRNHYDRCLEAKKYGTGRVRKESLIGGSFRKGEFRGSLVPLALYPKMPVYPPGVPPAVVNEKLVPEERGVPEESVAPASVTL